MLGKLIVIEGTDCSGKETQSKLLIEKLRNEGVQIDIYSFPSYETPTGKIIGGPYLGKDYICEGWFKEGASKVDPKVASLYYAADRKYNIYKINWLLENGINVILDRYVYSNMAHQAGKLDDKNERKAMYEWLDNLEFKLLELPKPDISVFLHMPLDKIEKLKKGRDESLDQHELDKNHLKLAEKAYFELADIYNFKTIECCINDEIRTIDDINDELFNYVIDYIKKETNN